MMKPGNIYQNGKKNSLGYKKTIEKEPFANYVKSAFVPKHVLLSNILKAVVKKVCVCVVYYSDISKRIMHEFLGLVSVTETTGEFLFNAIKIILQKFNLDLADCIGFGTDGANNMIGKHNSVWSRIEKFAPNCVKMQCICHSLALCVKKAFEILPSHLGFLLLEIPSWFKKST